MSKTAQGLIDFAKSKIGTPYIYGAKGEVVTLDRIRELRRTYGSNCVWYSDDNKAGQTCVDCSGLISWYTGKMRGSYQYKETAVEVIPISQRTNNNIGWAVWMNGHIGIYLGDDKYIAADGSAYGVRIANLSQNRFTHLLKLCDIDYGNGVTVTGVTTPQPSGGHYNVPVNFTYAVRVEQLAKEMKEQNEKLEKQNKEIEEYKEHVRKGQKQQWDAIERNEKEIGEAKHALELCQLENGGKKHV
jgi:hypothetical protein